MLQVRKTITFDIINKIFAHYYMQKVLFNGVETVKLDKSWNWNHPSFKLTLKSLENMTENDLNIVNKIFTENNKISKNDLIKHITGNNLNNYYRQNAFNGIEMIDILRQIGYATGFTFILNDEAVYYSVEDLVELGVFKLI